MNCERCKQPASQLRALSSLAGGIHMCGTCFEIEERAARASDPAEVARQEQIEREQAAFRERQRLDGLRPPTAEHLCEVHSDHGRAEFLRGGLLLCRRCASKTGPAPGEIYSPPFNEAPVLALERRMTELVARVAALEAGQGTAPAARAARKAVGQ